MNININDIAKSADTKFAPESKRTESKGQDDKGNSFRDSFNKVLEKKQAAAKKRIEDKSKDVKGKEEKDDVKDMSKYLNANFLLELYSKENTLDSEISLESMENFLVGTEVEGLFEEESYKLDTLMTEIEARLLDLDTDEETIESLLDTKPEEDKSLNFSIEEAKANLTKALDKGLNQPEIETKALEDVKGLEEHSRLEDIEALQVKADPGPKEDLVSKETEIKPMEKPTGEKDLTSKLEPIEENVEKAVEDKNIEKPIENIAEENTNIEEPKLIDSSILFNRIQSSIHGVEENSETLSTQNIQTVEDSMIKFMKVSKDGDTTIMRVKLYPEELGSIDISLKLDKGKLVADIIVASDKIKEMFLNGSNALNRNLIEQNIPVKNINITVNDTFSSLENASGEAQDNESRGNNEQGQDARKTRDNSLNNSPIDSMRIDSINKRHIGSKSLDILA